MSQPRDKQPEQPQSSTPAPSAPVATKPPAAAPGAPPAPSQPTEQPGAPPASPGTVTIPPVTVTPPPVPTPVRTAPRAQPATTVQPAPAARAPATPARTAQPSVPSAPSAPSQSATDRFDAERNNIFTPVGTAPTTVSREAIEALPQGTNAPLTDVLLQLPGVTKDSAASGNLHVRNEHANVSYRINGILLPDGLGAFGQFLDSSFVGSLSLITGALPAQYGLRTAGIVDITTAKFNNVGQIGVYGGSRETASATIQYGGTTGSTEYFFTGRYLQNILGIENPRPSINAIHDASQQDRSFAYISTVLDPTTRLSFIGGMSTNKFQIPNTPGAVPSIFGFAPPFSAFGVANFDSAQLNENQVEHYKFGVLALQKSVNDVDLQLAYFMRTATIEFTPDPIGDLILDGVASNVYRGSVANGVQGDSAFRVNETHTLRAGFTVTAEKTTVSSNSNFLPFDGSTFPATQIFPDVPFQAIDTSVLLGWVGGVYLADEWRLTDNLTLNTGARFDQMWQYMNANQLSPRASLTYEPVLGTLFHAGYARTFTPPVQVIAAPVNTNLAITCPGPIVALFPACTTTQAPGIPPPYYPMLPERANIYDVSVLKKVWPGFEVGADLYLKEARDLIDDGQFGQALVLSGFNYDKAENVGIELKAAYTNGGFRAYANWAWANQRATTRVSNQYLFDPAGNAYTANNWIFTDHTQIWTGSAGVSYLWYGTRLSADLIYGSGLRSGFENTDHNPSYAQVNTGIAREYAIPGWAPVTLRFDIVNLFDTSYVIRNGTGVGVFAQQFGPRRGFFFGLSQKFGPGASVDKAPAPTVVYMPFISKNPLGAVWTWTGFYIGGNFGYGSSRFNTDLLYADNLGNSLDSTSFSSKHIGAMGGGQAGYNWQYGILLAGLETDITFQHYRTATVSQCPAVLCNPLVTGFDAPVSAQQQHNLDWFGTVRGRLGVVITPDIAAYGTGGLAYGEIEHSGVLWGSNGIAANGGTNDIGITYADRSLRGGWVAGGGIEARLAGNVTGKIEYLHMDFGSDKAQAILPPNATPIAVSFNSRITEDLIRVGLNYKFDPYATYVPLYKADALTAVRERVRPIYRVPLKAGWTWTGFYFGANAGYAAGPLRSTAVYSDVTTGTPLFASTASSNIKGGIVGVQGGYNLQSGISLAGLETDINVSSQRLLSSSMCDGALCNPGITTFDAPVTLADSYNLDWFGTVRGRLGAEIVPGAVPYVTGGLAVGGIAHYGTISGTDSTGNPLAAPSNNYASRSAKAGWTVGGGIEARLFGNVTGKVEYLHMDFGSDSAIAVNHQIIAPIAATLSSHLRDDVIRLGVNYKFDPNAAAAAPAKSAVPERRLTVIKTPVAPVWTWTGYHLGMNAGYSFGSASTDAFFNDSTIPGATYATTSSYDLRGALVGVEAGYNLQLGSWLLGIEGDLALSGQRANPAFVCPGTICNPAGPVSVTFDQNQRVEWFSTLRARLGATVAGDAFAYVTGGAAVAGLFTGGTVFAYDQLGTQTNDFFSNVVVKGGWTIGGGVEAHICGNWTGKIEYLYLDFGTVTTNKAPTVNSLNQPVVTMTTMFNSHVTDQVVRAGINYKFD